MRVLFAWLSTCVLVGCGSGTIDGNGPNDGGNAPDARATVDALSADCVGVICPVGQHCDSTETGPECVNNECDGLNCSDTERCVMTPNGGAVCEDASCTEDVECAVGDYCNGTVCVPDVCVGGATRCDGQDLYTCNANGSGESLTVSCSSGTGSTCVDDGTGAAGCSCGDDWDCPQHMRCEGRVCLGSGVAPTCLLPAEPFTNALPTPEIVWGGTNADPAVTTSPFANSGQVVQTVAVANLDDDNADGRIDDRDIPEIIFVTFCDSADYKANGVLRAIHGGGPNKGQDYFASCGDTHWGENDALPVSCRCSAGVLDSTASIAVGDVNYDGVPEIVTITEGTGGEAGKIRIYDNRGAFVSESSTVDFRGKNPAPSIHNVDGAGNAEIVVGRHLFTIDDGPGGIKVLDHFEGSRHDGINGTNVQGPASCVANLDDTDARLEILGGSTLYRWPAAPAGVSKRSECTGSELGDELAWCNGELLEVWDADTVDSRAYNEGFCSIADVWGADPDMPPGPANPLDGKVEAVVVSAGRVQIFDGKTGQYINHYVLAGSGGGPPNIDDFDGDGYPEVGTASSTRYAMIDFQEPTASCPDWANAPTTDAESVASANSPRTPPRISCTNDSDCGDLSQFACNAQTAQCICLHNGWRRQTEDGSSKVTGSSVFDFNGDGAAEVVYNDECRFRVYDGLNGNVYLSEPSESRTRIEYPVIADTDNDGNAEIVFSTTNESGFCSENLDAQYNNGLEVWGDQNDFWVAARRIWNQHAYSVTNITEDGTPPLRTPEHWRTYAGRTYNLFRSNPRNIGIAPDLVVAAVQITSDGVGCGDLGDRIAISVQVENRGDVRGGQGSVLSFQGDWVALSLVEPLYADGAMTPLTFALPESIDPGGQLFVTVQYDIANNSPNALPDNLIVTADDPSYRRPHGFERECDEDNAHTSLVVSGKAAADLRVELGMPVEDPRCPTVPTTVFNDGSLDVTGVVVRYFAGDPFQGGTVVHEETFAQTIPAGGSVSVDAEISGRVGAEVTLHAIVDPDNLFEECNDGNNTDAADVAISCNIVD